MAVDHKKCMHETLKLKNREPRGEHYQNDYSCQRCGRKYIVLVHKPKDI